MTSSRTHRVEELFEQVVGFPAAQRDDFLRNQCGNDEPLRQEVQELVTHYMAASNTFLGGSIDIPFGVSNQADQQPTKIGRYRIVRTIDAGGMGVVYEAIQDQPRRTVALKVIRSSIASPSVRRRFEYEAEILGRLRHPGIAQIYEAATTTLDTEGQPYFAMEFIQGDSLVDYANRKQLGLGERVELMALVCDAVHYAHQRGVIHRDLKPANILVDDPQQAGGTGGAAVSPRVGQPKVLDFGIARLLQSEVQSTSLHTEPGQILGSLWYMSPEQIIGDAHEMDTSSDVYSLGVVLFEVIAGRLPYDLAGRTLPEVGRIIREQEPLRLGTLNDRCRGDVETIVAKALEKEKYRRYSSAGELAADLRRFLKSEPVLARPTSRIYQLRKFARRNRAIVGGILSVFAVLVLGIIGTGEGLVRARRAEHTAGENLTQARREAAKAAAVNRFLQGMLSAVDPGKALGRPVTVQDVLDEAIRELKTGSLSDEPEVQAEVRRTIGNTLSALGQNQQAQEQLQNALDLTILALGPDHPDVGRTLRDLGQVVYDAGKYAEAEQLFRRALEIALRAFGETHAEVAQSLHDIAAALRAQSKIDGAEALYKKALVLREKLLGPDSLEAAQTLNSLALMAQNRDDNPVAEALFRRSLDIRRMRLGNVHPDVAGSLNNLGNLLRNSGNNEEAESLLREALTMRRKILGDEHPDIAQALNNLAAFLLGLGRLDDAEALYQEAIPLYRRLVGEMHPDTARPIHGLARVFHRKGALLESEALHRESLAIRRKACGDHHLDTALSLADLGALRVDQGQFEEGESLLREALRIREFGLPPDHWQVATTKNSLAAALAGQDRLEEAERLFEESFDGLSRIPTFAIQRKQDALNKAAVFYEKRGNAQMVSQYREMLNDLSRHGTIRP